MIALGYKATNSVKCYTISITTISMRLPRVTLESIAWKAILLTVGLQTLFNSEETSVKQIQLECNYS